VVVPHGTIVGMDGDELISRSEVTAMLFAFADITGTFDESSNCWRTRMAKKKYRKMTPEEHARQLENQRRLEQLIEQRLQRDGTTREEIRRKLGLP
jgi:hypothetical protein